MPAELFRSVAIRRSSAGRRLGAVPLSVAVHGAVLIAAITIPLFATDVLPTARVPTVWNRPPMPVVAVPTVPPIRSARANSPLANRSAAPVEAPSGIGSEIAVDATPPGIQDVTLGEVIGTMNAADLPREAEFLPPPPPKPQGPIKLGGGVAPPRKIHDAAPVYPAIAIAARVQGTVVIEAIISTTGAVQDARVVTSIPLLDQAALEAVRQWLYTPTKLNNVPVAVIMTVRVEFKLQ